MNHDEIRGIYADRLWSWDWLGRAIGVHPAIRPADADGWVHQRGEMLHLEGKVSTNVPTLSRPQLNAVNDMGNLTIIIIHADPKHWIDNRPSRIRGYCVFPSRAFPWEAARCYQPMRPSDTDEDTLRTVSNVVVGWCWWAGTKGTP